MGDYVIGKKRLTVLLDPELAKDFEAFYEEISHKESTFVAHSIKEFLMKEGNPDQARLLKGGDECTVQRRCLIGREISTLMT